MRRLILIILAALLVAGQFAGVATAQPGPGCYCTREDRYTNCIEWVCETSDSGGGGGGEGAGSAGSSSGGSSAPRVCEFQGRVIACNSEGGTWSDYVVAWCRPEIPQPPLEDPIWAGNTDGTVLVCIRPGFSGIPDPSQQFRRYLTQAQQVIDPVALAWRAVASMNLTAPQMGMFPKPLGQDNTAMGWVGWPMWFWIADPGPRTMGPITTSATDEGFTVTATARVDRVEWDLGNGETITCDAGTKHPPTAIRGEESPTCGYTYEIENIYTITATTYWTVEWSAPSGSGTLQLELARSDEMMIGEIQVVNVPIRNR